MATQDELATARKVAAERTKKRRHDLGLTMVEVPISYRDWFKEHAARDGTTMSVAINAALEMFMDEVEGRKR